MAQAASIIIHLPAAPAQKIPQSSRTISVEGSAEPVPTTLQTGDTLIKFDVSDASATVKASVSEVLSNGKVSTPCTLEFTPWDAIEAVSADPAGFRVEVELK